MTAFGARSGVLALLLVLAPGLVRAEQEPEREGGGVDQMICRAMVCRNAEGGGVTCWCEDEPPWGRPAAVREVIDDSERPSPRLPAILDRPAPVSGFTLTRARVGMLLEIGYPFLDLRASFRLHEWLDLGLGYRGRWGTTNAGYASLKFRLFQNQPATFGLALVLAGGYTRARDQDSAVVVGGDSAFGEAILNLSVRRRRHAFDALLGLRLGWVRDCEVWIESEYDDCYYHPFADEEAGLMATVIFDVGYSVRIGPFISFFIAAGIDIFANSDSPPVLPRGRTGFLFEL